jgi:hypothetical protein
MHFVVTDPQTIVLKISEFLEQGVCSTKIHANKNLFHEVSQNFDR